MFSILGQRYVSVRHTTSAGHLDPWRCEVREMVTTDLSLTSEQRH